MTSDVPWAALCRACLTTDGVEPMLDELRALFEEVTTIKITDHEQFPASLCKSCITTIEKAQKFKEQCLEIDKKLNMIKDSAKPTTPPKAKTNSVYIKEEVIVGETLDPNEDLYVVVVESGKRPKQEPRKSPTNDTIEKETPSEFEIPLETEPLTLELYDCEKRPMDLEHLDLEEIEGHHKKINFDHDQLNILVQDLDGNNVRIFENGPNPHIPSTTSTNSVVQSKSPIIANVFSKNLALDESVNYSQEEIIVGAGEDAYEIINCDISELTMDDLNKQDSDGNLVWHDNLIEDLTVEQQEVEDSDMPKAHNCPICGKGFESKNVLTGHMLLHENTSTNITCPFCTETVKRGFLTLHINTHHKSKPTCPICKKTFSTPHNRKRHMLTHLTPKEFECDVCHIEFSQKNALRNHQLLHAPSGERFECERCNKEFLLSESYQNHAKSCRSSAVAEMIDREAIKRRYPCVRCGQVYTTHDALDAHVMAFHRENDDNDDDNNDVEEEGHLLCSECGLVLESARAMDEHAALHRGARPRPRRFACAHCGRLTQSLALLAMHERVHTNVRPYKCDKCPFAFKTKTHLTTHQLTHTQVKNFACVVCRKRFTLKGNLVVHMRTHTGERPYVCDVCHRGFIDSKYLKKHKLRKHGGGSGGGAAAADEPRMW